MSDDLLEDSEFDELDDDLAGDEEEDAPAKGKSSFLKVGLPIILVQVVVAYFLATYVVVPMLVDDVEAEPGQKEAVADKADSTKADSSDLSNVQIGPIFKVEDIVVNPAQSDGERLVVLNLALEIKDDKTMEEVTKREPLIRDIAITLLSSIPIDSMDGAANKQKLKDEFFVELKKILPPGSVNRVYFTNFIIQ